MEYNKAVLANLGSFTTLTLGNGGSSMDGNFEVDRGGGGGRRRRKRKKRRH